MADQIPATFLGRLLREPTVHFVLLAAGLFAMSAAVRSGRREAIEIDRGVVEARILLGEMSLGAALTEDQRRQVEQAYIDEQVLVREALALGLDQDGRIHDILAQKMRHVLSGEVIQPTDDELRTYYQANRTRYAPVPAVTLDELVVRSPDPLPESLADQLRGGVPADEIVSDLAGHRGVLPGTTRSDLTAMFSAELAERVFETAPGQWVGPHYSVRGQHWLRVTDRLDQTPPPLDVVRDRVRLDWIADEEETRLEQHIAELRARYTIVYTGEVMTRCDATRVGTRARSVSCWCAHSPARCRRTTST